jgi:hypothetical protein
MPKKLGWLLLDNNEIQTIDNMIPDTLLQLSLSHN